MPTGRHGANRANASTSAGTHERCAPGSAATQPPAWPNWDSKSASQLCRPAKAFLKSSRMLLYIQAMSDAAVQNSGRLIRAAGLRVTRQRVAVLDAVRAKPHTDATTMLAIVSAILPGVSHQAVYDCLAHLTEAGLLRRLIMDGGPAIYETRTHDNHHHCVCRACGLVVDVDCAIGAAPCLNLADAADFVIDEAEVIYRGLCRSCFAARSATRPVSDIKPLGEDRNG